MTFHNLSILENKKRHVIFGSGNAGIVIMDILPFEFTYFVDNDSSKWNKKLNEHIILPPDTLLKENKNDLVVIVASMYYEEISKQLIEMGFEENVHYINGLKQFYYPHYYYPFRNLKNYTSVKKLLEDNSIVVADIGAGGGLNQRWEQSTLNHYKAILFEPDVEEFKKLNLSKNENCIVINSALSDSSKIIDFHICEEQPCSSIYYPNTSFLERYHAETQKNTDPHEIKKTIKIIADSLDQLLTVNNIITEVDFIKIDTQGSELDILKGAEHSLKEAIGIEVEVEFAPYYENQPLFPEVHNFVTKFDLELIDLRKSYWKRKLVEKGKYNGKGQLIWGDALYFKTPEKLINKNFSQQKIIRAIFVYIAYGYFEFAEVLLKLASEHKILSEENQRLLIPLFINENINIINQYVNSNKADILGNL
ncbi:FkbM family methyltransferase [Metabacillus herbersteinensis]|uniref:FkbM family methyltransferase n=1 Tax=Metabacillus herbersteinensis TaxID=283816 RepID=A0ABV6GE14_9BACI